jgi:predicted nucleic acid-binding protein
MLVDTDVLIWYLRGQEKAAQFLNTLPEITLSAVNYMELVQGCRSKDELTRLKKDLDSRKAQILPITESISACAIELLETHSLGDGLQMADALIAATAIEHELILATANTKHFAPIGGLVLQAFVPA